MTTLPTFDVELIQKHGNDFVMQTTTLPDFVAKNGTGLILYFYPKDNTAGCTVQASEFSTHIQDFLDKGYHIIGISRDGTKSHQNFITKQNLAITLISDSDEKLCQHFDVIKEKNMYGKKVMGMVRSTFVFDKEGNLTHEWRGVKAKTHQTDLLEVL